MAFVLDTSVAATWAFVDEPEENTVGILRRLQVEEAIVPALWWFEIRNTLVIGERRKRITAQGTADFLQDLDLYAIRFDPLPDEAGVLRLARDHRLSVYDAVYLELAIREGLPLATLDSELAAAARKERVEIIGAQ